MLGKSNFAGIYPIIGGRRDLSAPVSFRRLPLASWYHISVKGYATWMSGAAGRNGGPISFGGRRPVRRGVGGRLWPRL